MARQETGAVHVARGASYIFLQGIATNILMAAAFAIIARIITTAEMGAMAVLLMITGASRMITCLGMPASVTKFVAEQLAIGNREKAAGCFYHALRANLAVSLPISAAVFLSAPFLSTTLLGTSDKAALFQILAFDIIATAGLLPTLNSAMLGLQKIRRLSMMSIGYMATRQSLIVAFTLLTRSLQGLVMAWLVSELLFAFALFFSVHSSLGPPTFSFSLKHLVKFSFPLSLQDAVSYVYAWFDRAILLAYTTLDALGIYNASMTAFGVLNNVPNAIATSLFPTYSAIQGKNGAEALQSSIRVASRYVCLIAMPLSHGLAATAKPALTLFVGEAYAEGTTPLIILSIFFALTLVSTALSGLLVVLGETVLSLKLTALNAVIGIGSAQLLLPYLGATGASLTRGIVMATSLLTAIIALRNRIRLSFDMEAFWKSLLASTVMAIGVAASQTYHYSKFYLPIYALIGGAIYLVMLRLTNAIKPEDVHLMEEYLGPRLGPLFKPLEKYIIA